MDLQPRRGEQVGGGSYKTSFRSLKNQDRVLTIMRESVTSAQIKSVYYLNVIMRAFFPKSVVHVTQAGNSMAPDGSLSSSFMSRWIDTDELHRNAQRQVNPAMGQSSQRSALSQADARTHLPAIQTFLHEARSIGIYVDESGRNFNIDPKGAITYMDLEPAWVRIGEIPRSMINVEKLSAAIEGLQPTTKTTARNALKRLIQLAEEDGFDLRATPLYSYTI